MALRSYEIGLLSIGMLPFAVLAIAGLAMGAVFIGSKLSTEDASEIILSVVTIGLIVFAVLIFVTRMCVKIRPVEHFDPTSAPADTPQQLLTDITATEGDVCKLITRTDKFIQSDIGKPGYDNPDLVTAAQQQARQAVGGPITDCDAFWPLHPQGRGSMPDVSGDAALQEADNRLTRMEMTLKSLTGPELEKTYDRAVKCEGFAGSLDLADLRRRLDVIHDTIGFQQQKYLKPIDDKNAALQRGEASDCDKKRGSKVAVTASTTGQTPNAS